MRGNKQILLNERGDEQSAYLLALEDFCFLPVRVYNVPFLFVCRNGNLGFFPADFCVRYPR